MTLQPQALLASQIHRACFSINFFQLRRARIPTLDLQAAGSGLSIY